MSDIRRNPHADFSGFGSRELLEAADLLTALATNHPDFLDDEIAVEFNPNSGLVFLVDENYNVAILSNDRLVQFVTCLNCGTEDILGEDLTLTLNQETCNHCRPN